jgi:hypothetical protein
MNQRYNYTTKVTINRQVKDVNTNQSTMTLVSGVSYWGYFAPVTQYKGVQVVDAIDQQYQFTTDDRADIRAGDQLIIGGVIYGVKGVAKYIQKSQWQLVASLSLNIDDDGV